MVDDNLEFINLYWDHPELSAPESFEGQVEAIRAAALELLQYICKNYADLARELGLTELLGLDE